MILLAPRPGEVIPSGSTYSIRWIGPAEVVKVKLKYSLDNGLTWASVHHEEYIRGVEYLWQVPKPVANKTACLIKILAQDASGVRTGVGRSDSSFTIEVLRVTSPKGDDVLTSGKVHRITWSTNETQKPVMKVKLYYTKDGGATWLPIGGAITGNSGYYDWTPSLKKTKSKCKVKVVLKDKDGNSVGSDSSDGYFTIAISPQLNR
jgi:hypothetical protein